jgi:predicted heme/steroid binding protein
MQIGSKYSYPKRNISREVDYMYRQKQFTLAELAEFDGSGGKPAYVAVDGIVYDMSVNGAWGGGTHFGLYAGRDLTAQFGGCHSGSTILEKLPKVGVLK